MTNRKISDFTALTAPVAADTLPIIDQSGSGTEKNKKITYANLLSKAPDGSASAPSFSFSSDPNTGISGGSDTLTLSTGGVGRLTISSAGLVTIPGDLTVSGTTTTIDSTTLTVKDKNIEIAKGNGNDAAVDGAGITIDSTDGDKTWNWVDATDSWTSSEHIAVGDNKKVQLGNSQDLQIFHDGSNSFIEDSGTGSLFIESNARIRLRDNTGNVDFAQFINGGGVELYHNNNKRLETTSSGVTVTGSVTATSFVGTVTVPDDSVTSAKIVDGAIVNADINASAAIAKSKLASLDIVNADVNASAAIAGTKISPDFGSQNVLTTGSLGSGNITVTSATPAVIFSENDANPDFQISGSGGVLRIEDVTSGYATRFAVNSDGHVDVLGNLDVGAGLDVTGSITATDNVEIDNAKEVRLYEADSNGSAYVGIKGATDKGSEASYTVSLPAAAPTANQILKANASTPTNLEWASDSATDSTKLPLAGGTLTGKVIHNYTSSVRVPVGTTGQRDGSPSNGDFRYNSTTGKFEGYQSGSWGEIGGGATGSADLLDIATSSGTGGGGSTFDGSRYRFKLVTKGTSNAVTPVNAEILRVSINGVMQQPNDGTGQGDMTEGYVVSGTDIIFDSAPPSGAAYFIVHMGTQIAVGNASTSTIADESSDTTCFPLFATAATGDLALKSGSNLTFNSSTGQLTATSYAGDGSALTGIASTTGGGAIYENSATISVSRTIPSGSNGMSAGPMSVANGVTLTVSSGSVYTVV